MHLIIQPLNPQVRQSIQQWLSTQPAQDFRKLLRAKIEIEKQEALGKLVDSIISDTYLEEAKEAAKRVLFYEDVLDLLAAVQTGDNPKKPNSWHKNDGSVGANFDFPVIQAITDHEPITNEEK